MDLEGLRILVARELDKIEGAFLCSAWKQSLGAPPVECSLKEADALSFPRQEHPERRLGSFVVDNRTDFVGAEGCSLDEMRVVYALAQKHLGFRGAVKQAASGKSWNIYRDR